MSDSRPLSPRQAQIVALVRAYHATTDEWPSDRYLARKLGIARTTLRGHLEALHARHILASPYSPVHLLLPRP